MDAAPAAGEGEAAAGAGGQQQLQLGADPAPDPSIDLDPDPIQPQADQPIGHCKFFVNTGRCHRGELCPFLHCPPEVLKEQRKEWLKERWGCGATRGGGGLVDLWREQNT